MMRDYDFMLTEEQRELRDLVEDFAQALRIKLRLEGVL